jgi:hypothetical protein
MPFVQLLLKSLMIVDGEALLLHAGRRPLIHSPHGLIELTGHELSRGAVAAILNQLLPVSEQCALAELGAAQHEIVDVPGLPGECFNVVAAEDDGDLWVEVRRGLRAVSVSARRTVQARAAGSPAAVLP